MIASHKLFPVIAKQNIQLSRHCIFQTMLLKDFQILLKRKHFNYFKNYLHLSVLNYLNVLYQLRQITLNTSVASCFLANYPISILYSIRFNVESRCAGMWNVIFITPLMISVQLIQILILKILINQTQYARKS